MFIVFVTKVGMIPGAHKSSTIWIRLEGLAVHLLDAHCTCVERNLFRMQMGLIVIRFGTLPRHLIHEG